MSTHLVAVIMGSDSDLPVMRPAIDVLRDFEIATEVRVVSAHRTPHDMLEFATTAAERGVSVIIAGAGGAAHLPGMMASATSVPVIGVPVNITALSGMDALLSIAQMPAGVPVACVGVDNARNAALLAARMLAIADPDLRARMDTFRADMASASQAKNDRLDAALTAAP